MEKVWYCLGCGFNADIEIFQTYRNGLTLGERYVCKHCGSHGLLSDWDAPKFIIDDQKEGESTAAFEDRIFGKLENG